MKAVIFGPGRIGCGFAGHLLWESGHDIVFAARNPVMVEHLNRVGCYRVRLVGKGEPSEVTVDRVRAVCTAEPGQVAEEIANAGLVATSVGCDNLASIAPLIAEGLLRRKGPVNVIGFENFGIASSCEQRMVSGCGRDGCSFEGHGFSPALISRIMSGQIGDPAEDEPIIYVGDPASEFIVDGRRLIPPVPSIKGMKVVDNYDVWVRKKLFIFSAGHATTAYMGYLKGYHYIHTAIRDPEIRETVLAAMREGQQGMLACYGPEVAGDERDLEAIVARFENAALNDRIERVGRDPLRKIGETDRLVGPARLAEEAGIHPDMLMLATAAALFYCDRLDPSCVSVKQEIETVGPDRVLREVCGLAPGKTLAASATKALARLMEGGGNSPLLSLKRFFWA